MALEKFDATEIAAAKRNVLVFGPPKNWKTRFAATGPKPMDILDLDRGTLSIRDLVKPGECRIHRVNNPQAAKIGLTQSRSPSEGPMSEVINFINGLYDAVGTPRMPATFVLDSLTELNAIALDFVLAKNKRIEPVFQDWGQSMEKIREIIRACVELPCHFILIAHEQTDKDELVGSIRTDPMVTGKLSGEIGRFFDDVFHAEMVPGKDGKNEPKLNTQAGGFIKTAGARSSGSLPKYVDPTWKAIYGE